MQDWHDFFLAQAAAAGVLVGLVFIGVSINLEKILSERSFGLTGRAAEALILLVAALVVSVLMLVPGQSRGLVGAELLLVGVVTWGWVLCIQLLHLRTWRTMASNLRAPLVLRIVLAQVATLPLIFAGIAVIWTGPEGLYWLVAGTILPMLVALFGAWVLLVEINR